MDDIMDGSGEFGQERFRSREELARQNEQLREELEQQREENALLAGLLTKRFDEMAEEDGEVCPSFSISDGAIDLFEALPEAFTLDEALDAAERLGTTSNEAAHHLRVYTQEGMVVQDGNRFMKTGRKPYF